VPGWLWPFTGWSPERARASICAGRVPAQMRVRGALALARAVEVRALPRFLRATIVDVSHCVNLRTLPEDLACEELIVDRSAVSRLPQKLQVARRISARDCHRLQVVPPIVT
jgi:hypothetical protein